MDYSGSKLTDEVPAEDLLLSPINLCGLKITGFPFQVNIRNLHCEMLRIKFHVSSAVELDLRT